NEAVPVTVTTPAAVSEIETVQAPVVLSVVQVAGVKLEVVSLAPKLTRTPPCGTLPVCEVTLAVRVVESFTATVLAVTASWSATGVPATYWLKCGRGALIVCAVVSTVEASATG